MDNLTHTFATVALVHAGSRAAPSRLTLAAAVVAANIQDLDSIALSAAAYHDRHRGITHSLIAVPIIAAVVAAVFHRYRDRLGFADRAAPSAATLFAFCLLAAAGHPLLDSLNSYGLKPYLPFRSDWYYGDLLGIIDPWMWLLLGCTALLLTARTDNTVRLWFALGSGIITVGLNLIPTTGAYGVIGGLVWVALAGVAVVFWLKDIVLPRRLVAATGLGLTLAYVVGVSILHASAIRRAAEIAGIALPPGQPVSRLAVIPTIGDLVTWRGLVETGSQVYRYPVGLAAGGTPEVEVFDNLSILTDVERTQVLAAPEMRSFLGFARFVWAAAENVEGSRSIVAADPRYDNPVRGKPDSWRVEVSLHDGEGGS